MSKIEWTGETWNPVVGCTPVSPGCLNCYAAGMAVRLEGMGRRGYGPVDGVRIAEVRNGRRVFTGSIRLVEEALAVPLRRKKPTTWFLCSMGDLFHPDVPFDFIDRVFAVMALCPQHTFQVLTKRPERMAEYFADHVQRCDSVSGEMKMLDGSWPDLPGWPLPNVWLGTSAEDQTRLEGRVPHLLRCPAAVRFLSCEPLLGELDLGGAVWRHCIDTRAVHDAEHDGGMWCDERSVDWVIVGGESGPHARMCETRWIRGVVDQCKAAGVPVFVKQLGARPLGPKIWARGGWCSSQVEDDGGVYERRLRDRKGGDPAEWPEDLRVREMPGVRV